jgi:four helix bundle protein
MGDSLPTYENGQDVRDRALALACQTVRLCRQLYDAGGVGRILAPQLINCSTSVPAMLEEARAAESRRDFISKCSIALKECRECHVRLTVLETCAIGAPAQLRLLQREAHELASILGAIIRNTRNNAGLSTGGRRNASRPPAR